MSARESRFNPDTPVVLPGKPTTGDPETKPAPGASVLAAIAKIPDPPPALTFVPDATASLPARAAALLRAKVAKMEADLAAGFDVSMVDLQRLADALSGKAPTPAADDADEYDLTKLDDLEYAQLHALLLKARR